ncbi:MAG: CDP-alcohol phosphatidyltransferase family protein [Candidatus Altiarchaeota archaeon]|nr:CDP-alcohol phosphatidyltransferase family protein [Candidatus Altiarchaeota archaeon]
MDTWGEQLNIRLGMLFSRLGIPPNVWTLLSVAPALAGFIFLYKGDLLGGLVCFALSDILDAIDGAVARVTNSASNLGAFLDGVAERYMEILLYGGLFFYMKDLPSIIFPNALAVFLLAFGALMIAYVKAYADHKKVITDIDELRKLDGRWGRNSRVVLTYAGMLAGVFSPVLLAYAITLLAIAVNLTALQRVIYVTRATTARTD